MIQNLPCSLKQDELAEEVSKFSAEYDFLYLPNLRCGGKKSKNRGYAFINFCDPQTARLFLQHFENYRFTQYPNSKKQVVTIFADEESIRKNRINKRQ
jgi:RNA recognition motif-containing protein